MHMEKTLPRLNLSEKNHVRMLEYVTFHTGQHQK